MTFRTLYIHSILLFLISGQLFGQSLVLSGRVTDLEQKPIAGAIVTLRPVGKTNVINFSQTNSEGYYSIKLQSSPEDKELRVSMMGFATQTIALKTGQTKYNVSLSEQVTQLKEVTVNAPGIREKGDTITYSIPKFATGQDKTLNDILKKLPGIEVLESGTIKYNGKEINKLYIEGKDLLSGRYNMATENINVKDLAAVDVMDNHQPIKALEDISFSQNPAINIRLKQDAKTRWAGTMKVGAGTSPFLWNDELFAMRLTHKMQTLNSYKTNNIGTDVTKDATDFTMDDSRNPFSKNYNMQGFINASTSTLSELDSRRSRFNKTHLASNNNLWTVGKDYDLTSNITFLNNRLNSDSYSETTYYLKDAAANITEEKEHAHSLVNQLTADLTLMANTRSNYLNNKLSGFLGWNDTNTNIAGSFPNLQHAEMPYRKLSDDLSIIHRMGKKVFEVSTFNMFQQLPQHLTVERNGSTQHQNIRSSSFFTNTYLSLSRVVYPMTFSLKAGMVGVVRSMKSSLSGIPDSLGLAANNLSMRYMNLYVSPKISMKTSDFEAYFSVPLSYMPYSFDDKTADNKNDATKFIVSPSLFIRYFFTPRLALSASASFRKNPISEQNFFKGLILSDYRHLQRGYVDYATGDNKSLSMTLTYRNPLKAFFSNINASRIWSYSPLSSSRQFIDDYILNSYLPHDNHFNFWFVDGSISKGIEAVKGMIALSASYQKNDASIFQNDVKTDYVTDNWTITPKFNARFARWLNMTYEMNLNRYSMKLKESDTNTHLNDFSETASFNIAPSKAWYIRLKGEHYRNEISSEVKKSIVLADADFTYCFKGGWELNIAVTNLFDKKTYSYRSYNDVMSYYESFRIRPRNLVASVYFRF